MSDNCAASSLAQIDLDALRSNLNFVKSQVGDRPILAVVKANAYGHGAVQVARCLAQGPVRISFFGVAFLEEAIALRDGGVTTPVLLLTGASREQIPEIIQYRLTPVVYNMAFLAALSQAAVRRRQRVNIHLKVDTGMGRLGIAPSDALSFMEKTVGLKGICVEGILTHFAYAGLEDSAYTSGQLVLFQSVVDHLYKKGIHPSYIHIANSAAVVAFQSAYLNLVRPGLMLYGYAPLKGVFSVSLKPVMQVKTRVIALKKVPADTSISYGRTFVTKRESHIATVSIGYADGYPCSLSNRGMMIAKGRLVPVAGRVCMDMTMLDVSEVPSLAVGDWVTVIGAEGDQSVWADRLSEWANTHPYEILCGIGARVQRQYI